MHPQTQPSNTWPMAWSSEGHFWFLNKVKKINNLFCNFYSIEYPYQTEKKTFSFRNLQTPPTFDCDWWMTYTWCFMKFIHMKPYWYFNNITSFVCLPITRTHNAWNTMKHLAVWLDFIILSAQFYHYNFIIPQRLSWI
jgi:hypothetical protein